MSKNRRKRDIISEQEFNLRMSGSPTDPQEDSPGDSEKDAGDEFMMGLNFEPDEIEGQDEDDIIYADEKSTAPSEVPSDINLATDDPEAKLPASARVISSKKPAPWEDLQKDSDTN